MKQKQILIILIVLIMAILACLTAYMFVNSNTGDYATLRISNSCTIEVPNENNTMEHMNSGVSKYSFKSGNLNITHQKSANNSEIKSIYEEQIKNSKKISGTYSIFIENKNTGDVLLITSSDLNLLKRVSSSVKFKKAANINMATNNTTDNSTANPDGDVSSDDTASEENVQNPQSSQQSYSQNTNNQNSNTPAQDNTNNRESQKEESKYPSVIEY